MFNLIRKREREIIKAFAEVLIPLSKGSNEMQSLLDAIEKHLNKMKKEMAYSYRFCLWALEIIAFFYYASFKTMTHMEIAQRERYINAWHNTWWSLKRTFKRFLETIIFVNYYGLKQVSEEVCKYTPVYKKPVSTDKDYSNLITRTVEQDLKIETDVCVIGSGAGGAVVAKELAEFGHKVVILEEGDYFTLKDFDKDVINMTQLLYRGAGVVNTIGWPPIIVPIGKCVGGTTLINSGTCLKAPDSIFDKWAETFGLYTWSSKQIKSHYEEVGKVVHTEVVNDNVQGNSVRVFERGLKALGHELKPLIRNTKNCCGSGICCFGCPTNAKKSVQLNYIPLALEKGAKLYANCKVKKITFNQRHATGIIGDFIDPKTGKKTKTLQVKAKVIVTCCGALHTPVLLKRSKLPNPSKELGNNLTLHPAAKVMALFDEDISGWKGVPQGAYSEALAPEGIKLEGIFLPPAFVASTLLLTGKEHKNIMQRYNNLAIFGMMVSDTSRGRVLSGPFGRAIPIYNINKADLPKYRRGIQFIADAFLEAGAKKVFLPLHTLPQIDRSEGISPILSLKLRNKDLDLQAFHPLGTCRMGADPRAAVIDPMGRYYGLDNLFIADGSIFPTSIGVNPMFTIMAAAHKIAGNIHREQL